MREASPGPQRTPADRGCADDGMMRAAGLGLGASFLCSLPVLLGLCGSSCFVSYFQSVLLCSTDTLMSVGESLWLLT